MIKLTKADFGIQSDHERMAILARRRYPAITAKVIGRDGNALAVMGAVKRALQSAGVGDAEVEEFLMQAMAGSYTDLLRVCLEWVDCR